MLFFDIKPADQFLKFASFIPQTSQLQCEWLVGKQENSNSSTFSILKRIKEELWLKKKHDKLSAIGFLIKRTAFLFAHCCKDMISQIGQLTFATPHMTIVKVCFICYRSWSVLYIPTFPLANLTTTRPLRHKILIIFVWNAFIVSIHYLFGSLLHFMGNSHVLM